MVNRPDWMAVESGQAGSGVTRHDAAHEREITAGQALDRRAPPIQMLEVQARYCQFAAMTGSKSVW